MIPTIQELNFPKIDGKQYATLSHATVNLADMGEKTISTQVKIDGDIVPDFSQDWEVAFQGEKYIMPLRLPQGAKESTSLNSTIDLTFQHWAVYQLKRWPFVTMQPIDTGTAVADEEVASVQLNLKDFCDLFGQVLRYYYGDTITIDLNPAWQYDNAPTAIEISHSLIWNVLIDAFHDKYGVRWAIEPREDNDNTVKGGERYVIKIGYPTTEVDHIFEYGFDGGLLKLERQVQSEDIRNMIKGRGGDTNIPFRYFKDTDPNNPDFAPDPDWIEELKNIYFTNLMPATYRSYIQGWKAAHISKYPGYKAVGENNAYSPWAYRKGFTDTKFHPVEFVVDEITLNPQEGDRQVQIYPDYAPFVKKGSSIDVYGPLSATLDNNDDIYPTIQGTGLDIAVDVEQILSDDVAESTESDAQIEDKTFPDIIKKNVTQGYDTVADASKRTYFSVPTGKTAIIEGHAGAKAYNPQNYEDKSALIVVRDYTIKVYNAVTGAQNSASGIPAGSWYFTVEYSVNNTSEEALNVTCSFNGVKTTSATPENKWSNTFDLWVKDIWNSTRLVGETDSQYSERVWKPILGDRDKNTAKVVFTSGMLLHEDYEFTIVDFPAPDTRKTYTDSNGVRHDSHWRITLAKSDAELEATGLYVPSTQRQGKAGDTFVFIGTEMTHVPYVVNAEIRLDDWKKDHLGEVKEIKPTFVVSTDRVRLNNEGKPDALINQLRVGNSLRIADKRFIQPMGDRAYETLYLQSLTYTFREPTPEDAALNPDVEIVLSNEYTTSANPVSVMQGEISSMQRLLGSISNVEQIVSAVGDKLYLRKDGISDISYSPTRFFSLLTSGDFRSGIIGGTGWGFYKDENGNWVLEADRVNVRQEMQVNTLVINQAEGRSGMEIDTAAFMEVTRVVDATEGYICYFDQKDGSVANLFHVDDVAFCNRWTPENQELKSYKRRVIAVGVDYITLSKTDVNGTGIPTEKDNIIHYGNYTDKTRQYVKVRDVVGGGYERFLDGLDSVNAKGTEYYFVGRQVGMYNDRPRWYIGDDNGYIEWVNGELNIKGRINSLSTIDNRPIKEYIKDQAGEATTLLVEYSPTGADGSWHATFAQGDLYMRQSTDNGNTWEGPMRIVGVDGERAHTLSVTSAGYGGSMQGLSGVVKVDGVNVISPHSRGLIMVTIDRKTLAKVEQIRYDFYLGNPDIIQTREDFIAKVDALDDSVFVCLLFADAMLWAEPLIEAMKKLGSLGDISMDGIHRTFAFIGYKGLTPGYALQAQGENQTLPPAEVSTYVADGMIATNKTGADGQYLKYQWAIGTSTSVTGVWSDTPLSALPGQYVWMRSGTVIPPATAPAQWSTPIRLTGDSGKDGESTYLLDLTNETEGVPCDSSGNPTGTLPSTGMAVYKGSVKDSGWTFTKDDNGCQSMLTSADTLQITSLDSSANTATVTVTATKAGCPTLTSIMNVYKVLPGQDGTNYSPNLITKEHYLDSLDGARLTKAYRLSSGNNPSGAINAALSGTVRWQLASGIIKEAGWYSVMLWAKREKGEGRFWVDINDCELSDAVIVPEEWTQYKWSVYVNKWLGMYGFLDLQTDSPNCAILISDVTVIPGKNPLDTWIPAASEMAGTNGVGISSTVITYGASANATVPPTSWQGSIPTVPQGQYLWTRTTITYTDGTSSTAYAVSRQGVNGEDGADGTDGTSVSILSTSVTYQTTKNASKPTGGTWLPNTPALENGDYLWTRTIVNYSDGNSTESFSVSRLGTDGTDGLPGAPGADGRTTYVHMAYASAVTGSLPHPSSVTGFSTSAFAGAAYIGFLTDYTEKDSESFADYDWHEYKGEDGAPATVFRVLPSVDSVTRHADGSLSDLEVSCTVLKTTGASAPVTSNERTLWYQRMPDGASGTLTRNNGVSVGVPVLSDTEAIIFELRNGNMVLDRERVPVLSDLEGFEAGGENLLLNAGLNTREAWGSWALADAEIDADDKFDGSNVLKIDVSGKTDWYGQGLWQNLANNPHLKAQPGTYYTVGIWVYSPDINSIDDPVWLEVNVRDSSGVYLTHPSLLIKPSKSGVWEHKTLTFKAPENTYSIEPHFFLSRNGKLWLSKPQLVRGAFLPDWAPSPYDFNYVTEALKNSGSFEGGLLLGSLIKLGYTDENDVYRVMAGLNGLVKNATGHDLAFWAGGDMIDAAEIANGAATTAIRHDGTAYFARNVIRMLLDHLMVGDNVRLDKEGLKLMVDGDVRAIIHNQPVPVDWNELANNSLPVGTGIFTNVSIPIAIVGGFRTFIYRSAEKVYDIGTVTANSIGSCLVMMNALQVFNYGHPIKGLWPISEFAYAELRCNGNIVATFALTVSSTIRYNNDIPGNRTNGSVSYECSQNISFTCPTAGNYSLAIVFPGADGSTSDDAKLLSLTCSCSVKGTVKLGLGNQTVIGSDGFVSVWGEAAIGVNKDRAIMRAGGFGLIVDASKGIQYVKNGGTPQQLV